MHFHFQVFYFASEKVERFYSDSKILMALLSLLFHLQNVSQLFKILIFSQDIWGNIHYVPEIMEL